MELKIKKTEMFARNIVNAQQINRERIASIEREELLREEELKEKQINAYQERRKRQMEAELRIQKQIANQIRIAAAARQETSELEKIVIQEQEEKLRLNLLKKRQVEDSLRYNGVLRSSIQKDLVYSSKVKIVQEVQSRRQLEMAEQLDRATKHLQEVETKEMEVVNQMKQTQRK